MTDDTAPPAAGALAFATGGVISGDQVPGLEPGPAPLTIPAAGFTPGLTNGAAIQVNPDPVAPETVRSAIGTLSHGVRDGAAVVFQTPSPEQVTMPSGNVVTFASLQSLTRRDRTEIIRLNRSLTDDPDRGQKMLDALLAKLVLAWSYPWPLPSQDPTAMENVPMYDTWEIEKRALPADKLLFVGPVTPDDHADPTSPTEPSGE